MGRLVIFGAGGCAGDILRTARKQYEDIVIVADSPRGSFLGIAVQPPAVVGAEDHLLVAIGDGRARRLIIQRFPTNALATIVAPTAIVGDAVELGEAACLFDYAVITSRTVIGRNLQMNLKASIGHDCRVGDDVTISPHAVIGSFIDIGPGVFIGAGAIIESSSPGSMRRIGAGAHIACGSVVLHDVPAGASVQGNPAFRPEDRAHLRE